ncbi:MAG TPA: hypothetical protein VMJ70_10065 [Candidatus Sulfotelmatobacter sp.]|nr:hypothetical protein [Candidatus Sulfotelmatobacter sp.]
MGIALRPSRTYYPAMNSRIGFAALIAFALASAAPAWAEPFAILAAVQGKVEVTGSKGGAPARAGFGRELERGDKVSVGAGGSATLYFSDGNVIELGEKSSVTIGGRVNNRTSVGPGATLPAGVYASVSRYVTRGSLQTGLVAQTSMRGPDEQPPSQLAPRRTDVTSERPGFSWRAVSGATRYRVTVSQPSGPTFSRETSGTTLAYPADAAPLARDADCGWRLEAFSDAGKLRTEETVFHVVSAELAQGVDADLRQIEQSAGGPDHAATHFLSGSYLYGRGLYQDAAGHFEALARVAPSSPAPHEALGNVYQAIGLMDRAASEYEQALALTRSP